MNNIKLYEEFINENYGIISKGDYPSFYITFNNKTIGEIDFNDADDNFLNILSVEITENGKNHYYNFLKNSRTLLNDYSGIISRKSRNDTTNHIWSKLLKDGTATIDKSNKNNYKIIF